MIPLPQPAEHSAYRRVQPRLSTESALRVKAHLQGTLSLPRVSCVLAIYQQYFCTEKENVTFIVQSWADAHRCS